MHAAYLLTGSNLGNRKALLQNAIRELSINVGEVVQTSSIFETEAWGQEGLPAHLNQALLINTALEPLALLEMIHEIEERLGRVRKEKWGVRVIDIDIIYFDHQIIDLPNLQIPHPLVQERNFALAPLSELAPGFIHPVLGKTNRELLQVSNDALEYKRL